MRPTGVEQYVEQYADPIACPDDLTCYEPFPRPTPEGVEPEPQAC